MNEPRQPGERLPAAGAPADPVASLEARLGLALRDRRHGARRADAQVLRERAPRRGGARRQRAARVPRRRGHRSRRLAPAHGAVPGGARGRSLEDARRGGRRAGALGDGARARPRLAPAARARRGADRRPAQGVAPRGRDGGGGRRALPRRRPRARCSCLIDRFLGDAFARAAAGTLDRDFKTQLQELAQSRLRATPRYRVVGEHGPDHSKTFEVETDLRGEVVGRGTGRSKKDAEQAAAKIGLELLARRFADGGAPRPTSALVDPARRPPQGTPEPGRPRPSPRPGRRPSRPRCPRRASRSRAARPRSRWSRPPLRRNLLTRSAEIAVPPPAAAEPPSEPAPAKRARAKAGAARRSRAPSASRRRRPRRRKPARGSLAASERGSGGAAGPLSICSHRGRWLASRRI